jgi:transcriptional regulator with XRE-family HTH domain
MEKTIYSAGYTMLLRRLTRVRKQARVTQEKLAERLGRTQSFVSKCERGERRLDIIELRAWCSALRVSFPAFVADLDKALRKPGQDE